MFIFKVSKLFHLSTHFGVFLAWNTLNNVISDKNMITEPCHRTNYENKWDKTNPKFAKKIATFPYFFFIKFLAYFIHHQYFFYFLFSRQNTCTGAIHSVLLLSMYFYLCLILCLLFLFQIAQHPWYNPDTIWT